MINAFYIHLLILTTFLLCWSCSLAKKIEQHVHCSKNNPMKRVVLCGSNIGEMNRHLIKIFPRLRIINSCNRNVIHLHQYDGNRGRDVQLIGAEDRLIIIKRLQSLVNITQSGKDTNSTILLIGRAAGHSNLSNEAMQSQRKLSSVAKFRNGDRRNIANMNELEDSLRNEFRVVRKVFLENSSILEQFSLFHAAELVVAQHGAGLSNIFFAGRSSKAVIEISPYSVGHSIGQYTHSYPDCFQYLANSIPLKHIRLHQTDEFASVDIKTVLRAARQLLQI